MKVIFLDIDGVLVTHSTMLAAGAMLGDRDKNMISLDRVS